MAGVVYVVYVLTWALKRYNYDYLYTSHGSITASCIQFTQTKSKVHFKETSSPCVFTFDTKISLMLNRNLSSL